MTSLERIEGSSGWEALEGYVSGLMAAVDKGMAEVLSPHDLTAVEFNLLNFCMANEECTATQLAEVLPTDAGRISRLVNGLVETGLLSRRRLTSDRRIVMLSLTDAGRERTLESIRSVQTFFETLIEGISEDELADFLSTALRITGNYNSRSG